MFFFDCILAPIGGIIIKVRMWDTKDIPYINFKICRDRSVTKGLLTLGLMYFFDCQLLLEEFS